MPVASYRAAIPPARLPFLLYDGSCGFCQSWVDKWRAAFAGRLEVEPSQRHLGRFPEIPALAYEQSLQLVELDGAVYSGACAVLRARALGRNRRGVLLTVYESIPGAKAFMGFAYRRIARNRRNVSILMKL